jgi:CDP-diacylglycerol--glycerol-3-phosphate 3-phosphatidyltransferase
MTIPNYLTLLRILILPFFLISFFATFTHHYLIAGILFMISALTDLLDGYAARKFDQISEMGKILDPLADKLTVISIFIALTIENILPVEVTLIILGREFIILLGAMFVYFQDKSIIEPSRIGKAATFLLYIAAASYIWQINILKFVIFLAIPLTLFSGARYCINSYNHLFRDTEFQN